MKYSATKTETARKCDKPAPIQLREPVYLCFSLIIKLYPSLQL